MNRKPVSLDYEFGELNNIISESFVSNLGPGEFPIKPKDKFIRGILAPNYDFEKSSAGMAWAYKELAEAGLADVYIILGACEEGINTYLFGEWDIPLGVMQIDIEFGRELIKRFPDMRNDSRPFINDTSIERQLPYLMYSKKDDLDRLMFLPILIGDVSEEKLVELADVLSIVDKKICVICSGNFTHFGKENNYTPFKHGIKENLHMQDRNFIEHVLKMDSTNFNKSSNILKNRKSIFLFMEIMKCLDKREGSLLNYYTTGEIDDNFENSIGIGALVFR